MIQQELDFTSPSPINKEKLSGQNKTVYDILSSGKTINRIEAINIGITALNSRISDLSNRHGVIIYSRYISYSGSSIKEYSLKQFKAA